MTHSDGYGKLELPAREASPGDLMLCPFKDRWRRINTADLIQGPPAYDPQGRIHLMFTPLAGGGYRPDEIVTVKRRETDAR